MSGKFFSAFRELRTGATLDELDSAPAEVVSAVKTIGKPGEITLHDAGVRRWSALRVECAAAL